VTARYQAATAALERLAAALDPGEFATTLTTCPGSMGAAAVGTMYHHTHKTGTVADGDMFHHT
jgi:hypothetical protein